MQQEIANHNSSEKPGAKRGEGFYFAGFKSPNYTPIPDEFFDVLAPRLSEAELRVLLYIMRRTFGFKKQADAISLSQLTGGIRKRNGEIMDEGTGLSKPAALKGIAGLQEKGIISVEKHTAEDGRNEVNVYCLRYADEAGTKSNNSTFSQPEAYSKIEYSEIEQTNLTPADNLRYVNSSPSPLVETKTVPATQERGGRVGAIQRVNQNDQPLPTNLNNERVKQINPHSKAALPNELRASRGSKVTLPMPPQGLAESKAALPGSVQQIDRGSNRGEPKTVKQINQQHGSLQNNSLQNNSSQQSTNNNRGQQGNLAVKLEPEVVVDITKDLETEHKAETKDLLTSFGLSEKAANELIANWPHDYIRQKVKLAKELRRQNPTIIRNWPGFIRQAISENYALTAQAQKPARPATMRYRKTSGPRRPAGYDRFVSNASQPEVETSGPDFATNQKLQQDIRPIASFNNNQTALLWEKVCEAITLRFRKPDLAGKLVGATVEMVSGEKAAYIALCRPWRELGLLASEQAIVKMAFSQEIGPGYNLKFEGR